MVDTLHFKKACSGAAYEPTLASASRALSHFPLLLFSAPQATTALGRVEQVETVPLACRQTSLTDQNSQAWSLFHKKNHSKFKVKQTLHYIPCSCHCQVSWLLSPDLHRH